MRRDGRIGIRAGLCALALCAISIGSARAAEPFWVEAEDSSPATERPGSFAPLAERLTPAVVNIAIKRRTGNTRSPHENLPASASGFLVSPEGHIVTNNHVVEGAGELEVTLLSGESYPATVLGRDPETDLALIRIDAPEPLPVAPLGSSDQLRVGDWVVAIGNPLGLDHSVTVGIISAKGRRVTDSKYDDFLQTDASINPGNSGGPLFDAKGRVIGINTMIRVIDQSATGIAFAVPIDLAKPLLQQIHDQGRVDRGFLGIRFQRLMPTLARAFALESTHGALVSDVMEGTPADRAELRSGDVIVEFDGVQIDSAEDLPRVVAAVSPGTPVRMVVVREGQRQELQTVLDRAPGLEPVSAGPGLERESSAPEPAASVDWGFEVAPVEPESTRLRSPLTRPWVVTNVRPDSLAARARLRPGDRILEVNHSGVQSEQHLRELLEAEPVALLQTRRGGQTVYVGLERP